MFTATSIADSFNKLYEAVVFDLDDPLMIVCGVTSLLNHWSYLLVLIDID